MPDGVLLGVILVLGLHVNLSARAPRRYTKWLLGRRCGRELRSVWAPDSAALTRARAYLGPGPLGGGVLRGLKAVVAVAGDVVERWT